MLISTNLSKPEPSITHPPSAFKELEIHGACGTPYAESFSDKAMIVKAPFEPSGMNFKLMVNKNK